MVRRVGNGGSLCFLLGNHLGAELCLAAGSRLAAGVKGECLCPTCQPGPWHRLSSAELEAASVSQQQSWSCIWMWPLSPTYLQQQWFLWGWHQAAELGGVSHRELWGDRSARGGKKGHLVPTCSSEGISLFSTCASNPCAGEGPCNTAGGFGGHLCEELGWRNPSSGSRKRPEQPFHLAWAFSGLQLTEGPCRASGQGVKACI